MPNMSLKKNEMPSQAPDVRNKNFLEVALGYTEEQALDEAQRCLHCKNKPCVSGCPVGIDIPAFIERVRVFVRREVLGEWRHMFSDGDGERQEYTFAFLVSGSMGMLQHWLESGLTLTPEQMAAMLTEFITQGVAVMR